MTINLFAFIFCTFFSITKESRHTFKEITEIVIALLCRENLSFFRFGKCILQLFCVKNKSYLISNDMQFVMFNNI